MTEPNPRTLSRRDFLRLSALTAAGAALASCAPSLIIPSSRPANPDQVVGDGGGTPAEVGATASGYEEKLTLQIEAAVQGGNDLLVIHSPVGEERAGWEMLGIPVPSLEALPPPAVSLTLIPNAGRQTNELISTNGVDNFSPVFIPQGIDLNQVSLSIQIAAGETVIVPFPTNASPWGQAVTPENQIFQVFPLREIALTLPVVEGTAEAFLVAGWAGMGGMKDSFEGQMAVPVQVITNGQSETALAYIDRVDFNLYGSAVLEAALNDPLALVSGKAQTVQEQVEGQQQSPEAQGPPKDPEITPAAESSDQENPVQQVLDELAKNREDRNPQRIAEGLIKISREFVRRTGRGDEGAIDILWESWNETTNFGQNLAAANEGDLLALREEVEMLAGMEPYGAYVFYVRGYNGTVRVAFGQDIHDGSLRAELKDAGDFDPAMIEKAWQEIKP